MYELTVRTHFSAAHNLRGYSGKCENLHGHNWELEVTVASDRLGPLGMVIDFAELKRAIGEVTDGLDHKYLNELEAFRQSNPTTELISKYVADGLPEKLPDGVRLMRVTCWETGACGATYIAESG